MPTKQTACVTATRRDADEPAMSKPTDTSLREIELVDGSYQPSKAELEQELDFSDLEGMGLEDVAKAMLRPAKIRYVKRPAG